MIDTFPDGCPIRAPDDHCSCFQSEFTCGTEDPCCRHDPDMHDPEDDTAYGRAHKLGKRPMTLVRRNTNPSGEELSCPTRT